MHERKFKNYPLPTRKKKKKDSKNNILSSDKERLSTCDSAEGEQHRIQNLSLFTKSSLTVILSVKFRHVRKNTDVCTPPVYQHLGNFLRRTIVSNILGSMALIHILYESDIQEVGIFPPTKDFNGGGGNH